MAENQIRLDFILDAQGADKVVKMLGLTTEGIKRLTEEQKKNLQVAQMTISGFQTKNAAYNLNNFQNMSGIGTAFNTGGPGSQLNAWGNRIAETPDWGRLLGTSAESYGMQVEQAILKGFDARRLSDKINEQMVQHLKSRQQYYAGMIISNIGYQLRIMSAAIFGSLGLATKAFTDFETQLKNTQSVTSATSSEMYALGDIAIALSEKMRFSTSEVTAAMYYLGSAGFSTKQIMQSIVPVTQLATATQSKLAETTEFVATTLAAFRMDASMAGEVSNAFAASIAHTQTTMEKLRAAMQYIGPIAHEVGINFKEVVAALSAAADVGFRGSQMGTYLRRVLQRLLDPTDTAIRTIRQLGLTLEDITPTVNKSLEEIFTTLGRAGMTAQQSFEIFGVRAAELGAVLARLTTKDWARYKTYLEDTNSLQYLVAIQTEALSVSFKTLWNRIVNLGIVIGDQLKPIIKDFLTLLGDATTGLTSFILNMNSFTKSITLAGIAFTGLFLGALGQFMVIIGPLVSGLIGVESVLTILGLALKTVSISMLAASAAAAALSAIIIGVGYGVYKLVSWNATLNSSVATLQKSIAAYSAEYLILIDKTNRTAEEEDKLTQVKQRLILLMPEAISWIDKEAIARDKLKKITESYLELSREELAIKVSLSKQELTSIDKSIRSAKKELEEQKIQYAKLNEMAAHERAAGHEKAAIALEADATKGAGARILKLSAHIKNLTNDYYTLELAVKDMDNLSKGKKPIDKDKTNPLISEEEFTEAEDRLTKWDDKYKEFLIKIETANEASSDKRLFIEDNVNRKINKARLDALKTAEEIENYRTRGLIKTDLEKNRMLIDNEINLQTTINELNKNRYFDWTFTDKEIANSFADTIYDMVKGIKTFEQVWQDVLDQSLKYFIQGFIQGVMQSWGVAIAQMMNSAIGVQTGGYGSWWQALLGAFGIGSGGAGSGYAGTYGSMKLTGSQGTGGFGYQLGEGGIVTRPIQATIGEEGPEAVIPLDKYTSNKQQNMTIVNVVDPSFVPATLSKNPDTVINIISGDIVNSGVTRKVIRRYT